jgi:Uma2 family endonuclease
MTLTRWTIDEVELLPNTWDDTRYEIIDGELHVSPQPHYYHQLTSSRVDRALGNWSEETALGSAVSAPGVIFALDEAVAPDVVWVSSSRLPIVLGADGKLHAAPDLTVEVLSPGPTNEERDREAKLGVYSRRGVLEYWIVSWQLRTVEVYRRADTGLRLVATLLEEDTLGSPLLPGFALPLLKLFADIPRE